MKEDIPIRKVTDIAMAIVPSDDTLWEVYLLNLKDAPIQNIIVNAKGYGERDGKRVNTTQMRYFFESIPPQTAQKVEPIQTKLFDIAHQYWISFQYDNFLFDKKYIFVRGSISEEYFIELPLLNKQGVMIR